MATRVNREVTSSRVVPLSQIVRDPGFNIRSTYVPGPGEQTIEELAKAIAREGLITPIHVRRPAGQSDDTPREQRRYHVVSGFRRTEAMMTICKENKIDPDTYEVAVVIKTYADDGEAYLANITENVRNSVRPADQAKRFDHLMKACNLSAEVIASSTGLSRSHVSNLARCWANLPEPILEHWSNPEVADVPLSMLFKIVKLETDDEKLAGFDAWLKGGTDGYDAWVKGEPVPEGEGDGEGEGEGEEKVKKPTQKDLAAALDLALAKCDGKPPKGSTLEGRIQALKWCLGRTRKMG